MVKGFTLMELITSLAILSIISLLSIKPLSKALERNKVNADTLTVTNIINTARSKAISMNSHILICGNKASEKCSRNWLTLQVLNKPDQTLLHTAQLSSNLSSANWSAFQNKSGLTIAPTGYTAHQNGTLYLCHQTYPDLHRAIVVSKSGRTTVKKDTDKLAQKCSK